MILYTPEEVVWDIQRHEPGLKVNPDLVLPMKGRIWYLQKYSQLYPEPGSVRQDTELRMAFVEDFLTDPTFRIPLFDKLPPENKRWAVYRGIGDGEMQDCQIEYVQSFTTRMDLTYYTRFKTEYRDLCVIDLDLMQAQHLRRILQ